MQSVDDIEALLQGQQLRWVLLYSVREHLLHREIGEDYHELLLLFKISSALDIEFGVPVRELLQLLDSDFTLKVIQHDDIYRVVRVTCPIIVVSH